MFLKGRLHYAWIIVAIAAMMGFITSSVRFAAAALVPYLSDPTGDFGWSYGAITLAFSLQWIIFGMASPYVGWLGDRYGVRWFLLVGAILFIIGMLLTGIMGSLWQFYLFFGVILGIASTIFTVLPVSGITLWFRRHLGAAMGIVWSFQGIGVVAFLFLIGAAFGQLGIRWIFWLPGMAGGALLLVLVRFFYNGPADIGLRPFGDVGDEPIQRARNDETTKVRARVFLQQAKRTVTFWNLIGIHYWGCMGHQIINVLVVAIGRGPGLVAGRSHRRAGRPAGRGGSSPGRRARGGGALGLPVGVDRRDGLAGLPAAADYLFQRHLGVLPVRRALWHRPEYRGAHIPHRQSPILRNRAPGQPLRLAEPGQRPGHGACACHRRAPVGHNRDLPGAAAHVTGVQHDGFGPSPALLPSPRVLQIPDWETHLPANLQPAHVRAAD